MYYSQTETQNTPVYHEVRISVIPAIKESGGVRKAGKFTISLSILGEKEAIYCKDGTTPNDYLIGIQKNLVLSQNYIPLFPMLLLLE